MSGLWGIGIFMEQKNVITYPAISAKACPIGILEFAERWMGNEHQFF